MIAFSGAERERLAKLLGLLGSDHAGERDAAGLAANRMVRQRRITWDDVLGVSTRAPVASHPRSPGWREVVRRCHARKHALRPWERDFISGLDRFPRLSPKQAGILRAIAARVLDPEATA